jgi:hypothetical protein
MMLATLAALLVVLLGFTGLAVDVANGYAAREMLQHAVDDAARTAQRWSSQVDDPGVDPAAVQTQAVAAAVAIARRDVQAEGLAAATVVTTALAGSHLRIAAQASVSTWFLRALGISLWRPAASSDVILWTPASSPALPTPSASGAPAVPVPLPQLTFPEGSERSQAQGPEPGGPGPGPGPDSNAGPGPGDPGPAGGDIVEGP